MLVVTLLATCVVHAAAPASSDWQSAVQEILGKPTSIATGVLTYLIPRRDLDVMIDGMPVPIAAGIASRAHFFHSPCGAVRAVGQICCTEDESNDVIDALRTGAVMEVSGAEPMFLRVRPRLMLVRFQGEGKPGQLAETVQAALAAIQQAHSRPTTQPRTNPKSEAPNPK